MRNELTNIERIERYLRNELSQTERAAFEQELKINSKLAEEVRLQKDILKGLENISLKTKAKKAYKKYSFGKGFKKWGGIGGTVILVTAASYFAWNYVTSASNNGPEITYELPELNENGEKVWADADKYLPYQKFKLNAQQDTVIETQDGIVMAVPANVFLGEDGKPVQGEITLEVKEAIETNDILKAGLTTKSGNKLLETGGMFYLNARQNDKSLKIDPAKGVYTEVPTNEIKPDMQLYEGKRMADGSIDWVAPKPLEKLLIPVDINTLTFYPPHYEDTLASLKEQKDKVYKDSLYYSYARLFESGIYPGDSTDEPGPSKNGKVVEVKKNGKVVGYAYENDEKSVTSQRIIEKQTNNNQVLTADTSFQTFPYKLTTAQYTLYVQSGYNVSFQYEPDGSAYTIVSRPINTRLIPNSTNYAGIAFETSYLQLTQPQFQAKMAELSAKYPETNYHVSWKGSHVNFNGSFKFTVYNRSDAAQTGINPSKIKAFWDTKFNNTLIATREFAERMQYIHTTCNSTLVDNYVNNLDKKLSTLDSMAAKLSGDPKFYEFAARNDGRVQTSARHLMKLRQYYERKTKAYTEAVLKTENEFWDKHEKETEKVLDEKTAFNQKDFKHQRNNFIKEFNTNLNEAYRQLGYEKVNQMPVFPKGTYSVTVISGGWKNVDLAVMESTMNRTTLNYADPFSGKTAVIRYEELTTTVTDYKSYDRVFAYLIPDKLDSYMRMPQKGETFTEKLNELMNYQLVVVAYKGVQPFYNLVGNVKPGNYPNVALAQIESSKLDNVLGKLKGDSQKQKLIDELAFRFIENKEAARQKTVKDIIDFRDRMQQVIFPCGGTYSVADTTMAATVKPNQ
jgi:hypothetical protein